MLSPFSALSDMMTGMNVTLKVLRDHPQLAWRLAASTRRTESDGPGTEGTLWWGGRSETLQKAEYDILVCLWPPGRRPRESVNVRVVVDSISELEAANDPLGALSTRLCRLRKTLRRLGVPWAWHESRLEKGWNKQIVLRHRMTRG